MSAILVESRAPHRERIRHFVTKNRAWTRSTGCLEAALAKLINSPPSQSKAAAILNRALIV
jgi:hypothetical protein